MDTFYDWIQNTLGGGDRTVLILHVVAVLCAVVVFNFALRRVLGRLEARAKRSSALWDDALIFAAVRPACWLSWVLGLTLAVGIVEDATRFAPLRFVPNVRIVGVVACLAWFLVRFIGNAQAALLQRKESHGVSVDRTTVHAIGQLLRISVIVVSVLVGLQSLGFSISGVLAFGGIGGIAVGFAAKDLLANFFGGLTIYLDRPFAIGDWIRSSDKQIEGTVEAIGWRMTRIRTFDKRPLYVPNSVFANITVENPSRMTNRRINETIGIRYDDIDKVPVIVDDIRAMLRTHPEIDPQQTLIVNLLQFNDYSVDLMIYTFTRTTVWVDFHAIKQDVLLKIAEVIARHGAEIAYPTRISYSAPLPRPEPTAEPA